MIFVATILLLAVGLALFAALASRRSRAGTPRVDGPIPPPGGGPRPPAGEGPAT